jgi:hypothetical protein
MFEGDLATDEGGLVADPGANQPSTTARKVVAQLRCRRSERL